MKKFSLLAMFLGLGLFSVVGCETKPSDVADKKIDAAGEHAEAAQAETEHAAGNASAETVQDKKEDAAEADKKAADAAHEAVKDGNAPAPTEPVAPAAGT